MIGNWYDVLVALIHQTIYFGKEETALNIPRKSFMSKHIQKRNFTNFKVAISAIVFTVFKPLSRFTLLMVTLSVFLFSNIFEVGTNKVYKDCTCDPSLS